MGRPKKETVTDPEPIQDNKPTSSKLTEETSRAAGAEVAAAPRKQRRNKKQESEQAEAKALEALEKRHIELSSFLATQSIKSANTLLLSLDRLYEQEIKRIKSRSNVTLTMGLSKDDHALACETLHQALLQFSPELLDKYGIFMMIPFCVFSIAIPKYMILKELRYESDLIRKENLGIETLPKESKSA